MDTTQIPQKQTPSPSPLQRMKSPFSTKAVPYRFRRQFRFAILTLTFVLLVMAINEVRCMKYQCMTRTRFYGGEDTTASDEQNSDATNKDVYVGGGSVLPFHWKSAMGNADGEDGNGGPVQATVEEKVDGQYGNGVLAQGPVGETSDGDDRDKQVILVSQGEDYDTSGYTSSFDQGYPVGS